MSKLFVVVGLFPGLPETMLVLATPFNGAQCLRIGSESNHSAEGQEYDAVLIALAVLAAEPTTHNNTAKQQMKFGKAD